MCVHKYVCACKYIYKYSLKNLKQTNLKHIVILKQIVLLKHIFVLKINIFELLYLY